MRMGGRPGAPRALAVPTGPLGSAGPPQTAANIFSCIPERLTENWLALSARRPARALYFLRTRALQHGISFWNITHTP